MQRKNRELNLDGLVGPTHNYSGLAYGNVASQKNLGSESNPKEAALQGLEKMKSMMELGLLQGVLPPQERPHLPMLRTLGFTGSNSEILEKVWHTDPVLLAICSSASSMWTANAATVSPSADTLDHKVHFTPANLFSNFHRSLEASTTARFLKRIFPEEKGCFVHHPPLPSCDALGDEGAANHIRLCGDHGKKAVEVFLYGRFALNADVIRPKRYPARQTREASMTIARLHGLDPEYCLFVQQNPDVVDEGVFHNDVISVGNENVLFYHEKAYCENSWVLASLKKKINELTLVPVLQKEVNVSDTVSSYLFNSQLVTLQDGTMALIAPHECREIPSVNAFIEKMLSDKSHPINQVLFFDLRQSMRNGGGPACLRFRVALTEEEQKQVNPNFLLTPSLYKTLAGWIERHYRDRLVQKDLADPQFLTEVQTALDELTQILGLGSFYSFQ